MPKTNYRAYAIGTKVWGISRMNSQGKETDHVAIYQAVVEDVTFTYDEKTNKVRVLYMLKTPSGEDWGDSVYEDSVDESFEVLNEKMKSEWINNSNTFGD